MISYLFRCGVFTLAILVAMEPFHPAIVGVALGIAFAAAYRIEAAND